MKRHAERPVRTPDVRETVAWSAVRFAAAISPATVRDVRREQWQADLLGAADIGLSPARLARGTLATAVFHRVRSPAQRVLPGYLPRDTRATVGFITVGALSIVLGLVAQRTIFYVWTSLTQHRIGLLVELTLVFLLPLAMFLIALLRTRTSSRRRIVALVIFGGGSVSFLLGQVAAGPLAQVANTTAAVFLLAAWAIVRRAAPDKWFLMLAPLFVSLILNFVAAAATTAFSVSPSFGSGVHEIGRQVLVFAPIATAVLCGLAVPHRVRMRTGALVREI